jgi:cold shock CspA family protein
MSHRPTQSERRAPRQLGIIVRVATRDNGFIFITGLDRQEYFAHKSAFAVGGVFDVIEQGDGVSFRVARTGKGFRAFDVQRAEGDEIRLLKELEENRGNA